jgi:hypothetical protein
MGALNSLGIAGAKLTILLQYIYAITLAIQIYFYNIYYRTIAEITAAAIIINKDEKIRTAALASNRNRP